tara:strand:+ start:598 stop:1218 length:621 start_codon:yes stop_codon:yes gene_type:complete
MSFKNKLKVPDLCGAGSSFDEALGQFDTLQTQALNEIDGAIDTEASAIIDNISAQATPLVNKIGGMLPELPDVPNINFQAELKALNNLTAGSEQYLAKAAELKSQFGGSIDDIDSLISDVANTDICALDNFSLSSDGEVAKNAKDIIQGVTKEVTETLTPVTKKTIKLTSRGTKEITNYTNTAKDTISDVASSVEKKFTLTSRGTR